MNIIRKTEIILLIVLFILTNSVFGENDLKDYKKNKIEKNNKEIHGSFVVILGASYARGWNPDNIEGISTINKGVNGEQSFEMLARFETDVVSLKPNAVIIWGFINDVFRSKREDIEMTMNNTKKNINKMLKKARQNNIIPILATEVTITGPDSWSERLLAIIGWILGKESYQDYINKHVIAVNKWIREIAARENLLVLDLKSVLADEKVTRKRKYAAPDGSHISLEGYKEINNYASKVLGDYFGHK